MGYFGQNIIRDFAPRTPKAKAESEAYEALLIALVTVAARHSGDVSKFISEIDKTAITRLSATNSEAAQKICSRMLDVVREKAAD